MLFAGYSISDNCGVGDLFRRIVSGIMLTLLLVGMFTLAFNVQPAKSEPMIARTPTPPWPMFQHDAQHTGRSSYVGRDDLSGFHSFRKP
jgi:hypothetical protein